MPASTQIHEQLAAMSTAFAPLAAAWHVAILAVVAAILAGWRPSKMVFATLLLAPLTLSVGSLAIAFGNDFNGVSFALLTLALFVIGSRFSDDVAVVRGPVWSSVLGVALILFGVGYPHFVDGPWYAALATAPVGVVPCPTLAVLAGATLVGGGLGSRALPVVLALWCGCYAAFGILRLGVTVDVGLLVALVGLIAIELRRDDPSHRALMERGVPSR